MSKHTKEPWVGTLAPNGDCGIAMIAYFNNKEDRDRTIVCVDACAGIEDPAATIAACKDALQLVQKQKIYGAADRCRDKIRNSLDMLEGK